MNVSVSTVAPERSDLLWGLYRATFGPSVTQCVQEQLCYTEATFRQALGDEDIVKFVVEDGGAPIGLALATFNLEKARIAYVNPRRLELAYPDRTGRILYFTCLAIHPSHQNGSFVFTALVRELTVFTDRHRAVVAFDFSTEKNARLPLAIVRVTQQTQRAGLTQTKQAQYKRLGGPEYGVIELT
jgi:hypothetical protein